MTELNPHDSSHNLGPGCAQENEKLNSNNASNGGMEEEEEKEAELRRLLIPNVADLPPTPPTAVQSNFVTYYAPGHVAFKDEGGVIAVDFNIGKTDRSGIRVTGKRKKNAQHFESNTALCKVITKDSSYIVRCCTKGFLLEVNERLMNHPGLLNSSADREGYIAIIMPKQVDWHKTEASFLGEEDYKKLRDTC